MRMSMAALLALTLGSVPLAAQESSRPAPRPPDAATAPVNLNTATATQLESLPGIGPAMAQRIVEYRQQSGGFKKIEEIIESSRSPLILLRIPRFDPSPTVSESRKKSQEISR